MSPEDSPGLLARIRDRLTPAGWTAVGTAVVLLYSLYRRTVDLNPDSLWLDDAWVAVLSRGTLGELLANGSTSPPIFNLWVALSIWTLPDLELAAQLVPFVCGLGAIVATAWAAFLLTKSAPCAVFAAALYACDPFAIEYATRVKQYSSDALVCALELGAFHLLLDRFTRRRLWAFAGLVSLGLFVSTLSVFVGAVLVPVALVTLYRRQEHSQVPARDLIAVGAVTFGAALVLYVWVLRGLDSAVTAAHWGDAYLPTESVGGLLAAAGNRLGVFSLARLLGGLPGQEGVVPGARWIGAGLLGLGAVHAWLGSLRSHLLAALLIAALVVGASAAGRLPLGIGRVELFLMPLLACALACGVALGLRLRNERVRTLALALALAFAAVQLPRERASGYPVQNAAPVVAAIAAEWRPGDGLLTNLHGTFALALYGPWSVSFVADPRLMTAFHPVPVVDGFSIAEDTGFAPFEAARPGRIFVFGSHDSPAYRRQMILGLQGLGYTVRSSVEEQGSAMFLLERSP